MVEGRLKNTDKIKKLALLVSGINYQGNEDYQKGYKEVIDANWHHICQERSGTTEYSYVHSATNFESITTCFATPLAGFTNQKIQNFTYDWKDAFSFTFTSSSTLSLVCTNFRPNTVTAIFKISLEYATEDEQLVDTAYVYLNVPQGLSSGFSIHCDDFVMGLKTFYGWTASLEALRYGY